MYRLLGIAIVALFASVALGVPTAPTLDETLGYHPIKPDSRYPSNPTLDEVLNSEKPTNWDFKSRLEVQALPDSPGIIIDGAIEEVYDKLKKRTPDFDEAWKGFKGPETENEDPDPFKEREPEGTVTCQINKRWSVDAKLVKDGIERIRHSRGKPRLQQDPKHCGRLACLSRAAIYWCNDYDEPQRISSRRLLADGAEAVLNQCTKDGDVAGDFEVPGGWRVSVKAEDSDCSTTWSLALGLLAR